MKGTQYSLLVILAMLAGAAGGVISHLVFIGVPAFAEKKPQAAKIVEAEEIRLVDKEGKLRAKLGSEKINDNSDMWGLKIYSVNSKPEITLGTSSSGIPGLHLMDEKGK